MLRVLFMEFVLLSGCTISDPVVQKYPVVQDFGFPIHTMLLSLSVKSDIYIHVSQSYLSYKTKG